MGNIYSVHTNQKKKVENEIIDVKNFKKTQINGEIYHIYRLENSLLLRCLFSQKTICCF